MGILNFRNRGTEDINYGRTSKEVLRILPKELHRKAQVKLARLGAAPSIHDLREIRGNRFETLKGDRKGQYSIRIVSGGRKSMPWMSRLSLTTNCIREASDGEEPRNTNTSG